EHGLITMSHFSAFAALRVDAHQKGPSLLFDGIEERAAVARPEKGSRMSSARSGIIAEHRAAHIEVILARQISRFRIFRGIHDPQIGLGVGTDRLRGRTMKRKLATVRTQREVTNIHWNGSELLRVASPGWNRINIGG